MLAGSMEARQFLVIFDDRLAPACITLLPSRHLQRPCVDILGMLQAQAALTPLLALKATGSTAHHAFTCEKRLGCTKSRRWRAATERTCTPTTHRIAIGVFAPPGPAPDKTADS